MMSPPIDLQSFFRNKSVALIGGADSAITAELQRCSQADLIISVHNHAYVSNLSPHIIFSGWVAPELTPLVRLCVINIANPESHNHMKACAVAGAAVVAWDSQEYKGVNPNGPNFEWSNVLAKEINARPLTGIAALRWLLTMPVREVFVTGLTCYGRMLDGCAEFPQRVHSHRLSRQIDYLEKLPLLDARVTYDTQMNQLYRMTRVILTELNIG